MSPTPLVTKHISLDREDDRVKQFVRSLPLDAAGSILELDGHALVKVVPVADETVDEAAVKAAILRRRDESRNLNRDWEAVDQEVSRTADLKLHCDGARAGRAYR